MRIIQIMQQLLRDNRGATAVEYGLIVSLVIIAIIVGMQFVADQNSSMWNYVGTRMSAVM